MHISVLQTDDIHILKQKYYGWNESWFCLKQIVTSVSGTYDGLMFEKFLINNYLWWSSGSVWVTEDILHDTGFKQCKPRVQDCPWLSPAAPVSADGIVR